MVERGYFTTFNLLDERSYLMHSSLGCILQVKGISLKQFAPKCFLKISYRIKTWRAKGATQQYKCEEVVLWRKCTSKSAT
jgi:hypothetical protein